jgi:hypothetical protein
MKTGTISHKYSLEFIGERTIEDQWDFETFHHRKEIFYAGTYDPSIKYAVDTYTLMDRTLVTLTHPASVDFNSSITISNIPVNAYLYINGVRRNTMGGDTSKTLTNVKEDIIIKMVGKYKTSPETIVIPVIHAVRTTRDGDSKWQALENATPAQIDTWVDNNVTTLAQARELFKLILKAIRVLHDKDK